MKHPLLITIFILAMSAISDAQSKDATAFYNKYKDQDDVFHLALDKPADWIGLSVPKHTFAVIRHRLKKIKSIRVLYMDSDLTDSLPGEIKHLQVLLKGKGFEELISVKKGGMDLRIMARGNKKMCRDVIIMNQMDNFIFVQLHGKLFRNDVDKVEDYVTKSLKSGNFNLSL